MSIITDQKIHINSNFEDVINSQKGKPIGETLIDYKMWKADNLKQPIYRLPLEYCRFRSENGRIKTETLTYATRIKKLDQFSADDQKIISGFLEKSDPSKNEELMKSLKREGQNEPAIITADGFLINGNRRRWALEKLYEKYSDRNYKFINVIILPGTDHPDSPSIVDIALLENRLQVNIDGRSDYTLMNRALTFRSNVKSGIPLKEMLRDDAAYADLSEKDFNKEVLKWESSNFGTLDLIDEYLEIYKMKGDYERIAHRWESFRELNAKIISNFRNPKFLQNLNQGYDSEDIGELKVACFTLIKLKDPTVAKFKRHTDIIREIKGWMGASKKDFLKLADIEDVDDSITNLDDRDRKWQHEKSSEVVKVIKSLQNLEEKKDLQEGPIDRLREALKKLEHDHLDEDQINRTIDYDDLEEAMKISNRIQTVSRDLYSKFSDARKKHPKKLKKGKFKLEDFKNLQKNK